MNRVGALEHTAGLGPGRKKRNRPAEVTARERMLAILDNAAALIAMADHGGTLFYINPAGRVVLGLASDDEAAGMTLIKCVAPGVRARITERAIPAAIRDGVWCGDSTLLASGGREVDATLLITAHHGEDGQLEGVSLLAQETPASLGKDEALRVTHNELLRLSAQHLGIQEAERRRIAADLHDGLGQSLSLASLSIETVSSLLRAGETTQAVERLDRLRPKVKEMVEEVRRIAMTLRPATLDSLGILATVAWFLREIEAACPGIKLERDFNIAEADVPMSLKTPIFRILQEASGNAIKHAAANRIKVRMARARGVLELSIEDDGQGFDPAAVAGRNPLSQGLGLQTMRERALLSWGRYELKSAPGKGTRIRVRWPLSLRELALERAAMPETDHPPSHGPGAGRFEPAGDLAMLHNLSVCVACVRSINSNG